MDTAVVTGGTGALGRVVTTRLIAHGYRCIVPYATLEEAQELRASLVPQLREQLVLLEADMLDEDAVEHVFDAADSFGAPYALVHLIGGVRGFQPVSETNTADWDFLMQLNLRSFFLSSRSAMRRFEKRSRGRIVSIGAMASVRPAANQAGYGVAKAAVAALTRILADEGRSSGITANCIAPSVLRTDTNLAWGSKEDAVRWVTPEQIAATIAYLLSEDAASITGTVIQAFGGVQP